MRNFVRPKRICANIEIGYLHTFSLRVKRVYLHTECMFYMYVRATILMQSKLVLKQLPIITIFFLGFSFNRSNSWRRESDFRFFIPKIVRIVCDSIVFRYDVCEFSAHPQTLFWIFRAWKFSVIIWNWPRLIVGSNFVSRLAKIAPFGIFFTATDVRRSQSS